MFGLNPLTPADAHSQQSLWNFLQESRKYDSFDLCQNTLLLVWFDSVIYLHFITRSREQISFFTAIKDVAISRFSARCIFLRTGWSKMVFFRQAWNLWNIDYGSVGFLTDPASISPAHGARKTEKSNLGLTGGAERYTWSGQKRNEEGSSDFVNKPLDEFSAISDRWYRSRLWWVNIDTHARTRATYLLEHKHTSHLFEFSFFERIERRKKLGSGCNLNMF